MLAGCWLIADLDGTLISTPHKAHGKYISITESPCFHPIRRWLANGGNVCVITTADLRTLMQVYFPLQPYLIPRKPHIQSSPFVAPAKTASVEPQTGSCSTADLYCRATTITARNRPPMDGSHTEPIAFDEGTLLLSLYSGAALYRCTPNTVELMTDYVHGKHAVRGSGVDLVQSRVPRSSGSTFSPSVTTARVGVTAGREYTTGTCIPRDVSAKLLTHLTEVYLNYLQDLISSEETVVAIARRLSRRYQITSKRILRFLEEIYHAVHTKPSEQQPSIPSDRDLSLEDFIAATRGTDEVVAWKMSYLCTHPELFRYLGLLREECLSEEVFFSTPCAAGTLSRDYSHPHHRSQRARREDFLKRVQSALLKNLPPHAVAGLGTTTMGFASYMVHALGVDTDLVLPPIPHAGESTRMDVPQVILLGIPLDLFSRYFRKSLEVFAEIGVNVMPQPNSVVFSKLGINKSTLMEYLVGGNEAASRPPRISPARVLAFGDNPHTTDHGLAVFEAVRFISVEKAHQREERHERIQRRLARTQTLESLGLQPRMPDGTLAPSYKELVASLRRAGPLMDDRLLKNIAYIGNEEDGTAIFLTALMDYLKVPSFTVSSQCAYPSHTTPVETEEFVEAVAKAEKIVSSEVQGLTKLSKL